MKCKKQYKKTSIFPYCRLRETKVFILVVSVSGFSRFNFFCFPFDVLQQVPVEDIVPVFC